ncbi:MAG: DUF29 domain-containing protein [Cytophagaceae bacterium]|nr:DUF29 domain-containing protein [Cytophagaceae bacterium]
MKRDWEELTATSYHDSVTEIKEAFENQEFDEVSAGLNALLESMSQELRRTLKSQLVRLMEHIIKWRIQPGNRSKSWQISIRDARNNLFDIMETKPSLNRRHLEEIWDASFLRAVENAEEETDLKNTVDVLSWQDVFETPYRVSNP